jgi:ubiquinone/menaquinone biosynthesis C-methylase UbiE
VGIKDRLETITLKILTTPGWAVRLRRNIIEVADIFHDTKVIDIATGVGGSAFAARQLSAQVTAIDSSEERIAAARRNSRANAIDFRVMDAGQTSFSDREFDVALVILGLHEMTVDGARRALVEARRISKKLLVYEFAPGPFRLLWLLLIYLLAPFEPKGFLEFTRQNLDGMIEGAGWTIERKDAGRFATRYLCV